MSKAPPPSFYRGMSPTEWLANSSLNNIDQSIRHLGEQLSQEPEKIHKYITDLVDKVGPAILVDRAIQILPFGIALAIAEQDTIRTLVTRILRDWTGEDQEIRLEQVADKFDKSVKELRIEYANADRLVPVDAEFLLVTEPAPPDQVLKDAFDVGDKVAIIGPSKMRKSFLLLQMSICLSAGRDCLVWNVSKPRRILHCQFEITEAHFHRRVRKVANGLGISPEEWEGRLQVLNLRGKGIMGCDGIKRIAEVAVAVGAEIVILDPFYKLFIGSGNNEEQVKEILGAIDTILVEQTGAAVGYTLHDAKGNPGDRNLVDRSAGSGVQGRDYDYAIVLTEHESRDKNLAVVESVARNYPASDPFTIRFHEDREADLLWFGVDETVPANVRKSRSKEPMKPMQDFFLAAKAILGTKEMDTVLFKIKMKEKANRGETWAKDFVKWATTGDDSPLIIRVDKGRGKSNKNFIRVRIPDA